MSPRGWDPHDHRCVARALREFSEENILGCLQTQWWLLKVMCTLQDNLLKAGADFRELFLFECHSIFKDCIVIQILFSANTLIPFK